MLLDFFRIKQSFFFFNDTATTEIYTLSLHDALPISIGWQSSRFWGRRRSGRGNAKRGIAELEAPYS